MKVFLEVHFVRKNKTGSRGLLRKKLCNFEFWQCKAQIWIKILSKGILWSLPFCFLGQTVVCLGFKQSAMDCMEIQNSIWILIVVWVVCSGWRLRKWDFVFHLKPTYFFGRIVNMKRKATKKKITHLIYWLYHKIMKTWWDKTSFSVIWHSTLV